MEMPTVYQVTTEGDCEGRSTRTLAYAIGDPKDIKVHYDKQKEYTIDLHKINIVYIEPESVRKKRTLLEEKESLEKRLKKVEGLLKQR